MAGEAEGDNYSPCSAVIFLSIRFPSCFVTKSKKKKSIIMMLYGALIGRECEWIGVTICHLPRYVVC